MKVVSINADFNECVPHIEVIDKNGGVEGIAYGARTARLFSMAEEMYGLLNHFLNTGKIDRAQAQKIVDEIEADLDWTLYGMTGQEFLSEILGA